MRREELNLACSPLNVSCVQVSSSEDYLPAMRKEVRRFKELLEYRFPIPKQIENDFGFFIKKNDHDFGIYLEVECWYNPNSEAAGEFAYFVEANLPETWDDKEILKF